MTLKQSDDFIKNGAASKVNGEFQLLAMQSGTVLSDQFTVGELIEPGEKLFTISDESFLWVEAKLTHIDAQLVKLGSLASVISDGHEYAGIVMQAHHALDEGTRTLGVRIEVSNPDHLLRPGLFVQVKINSSSSSPVLAVPINAVLRSPDGYWGVFVEHKINEFEAVEVELLRTVRDLAIIEGIKPHTRVVDPRCLFCTVRVG